MKKGLLNTNDYNEIAGRVKSLKSESERTWGKMDAAQMMSHCSTSLLTALGEHNPPRPFIKRLVGPLFKGMLLSKRPFPKNSPTDPSFVMTDKKEFEKEKKRLLDLLKRFYEEGNSILVGKSHPFFGKLTTEEWSWSQYKHLDHHLRQFGA